MGARTGRVGADEREALAARVLGMIEDGPDGDPAPFDDLAFDVFAYQYHHNPPYRAFCDARRLTPGTVAGWKDIPAFPTHAFKEQIIASFPVEEAVMAQLTSGTTLPDQRGKIFRDDVGRRLVFAANRVMTGSYLFPDFEGGRRCRLLILAPSPEMAPSMGMAIGMEQTRVHFGTDDSRFLLGWSGIDIRGLVDALGEAERSGVPVALVGSTSAFVYFLKAAAKRRLSFTLPKGSRLCDGGGYRGRFGEVTRDDYYRMAGEILGVAPDHCVNTLGMAESATNYFDDVLRAAVLSSGSDGAAAPRRKLPPPWTRVDVVSVEDLSPLPPGEVGLLRHWDLANLPTALAIQSDNLGLCLPDGGFEIVGRATVVDGKVAHSAGTRTVGPMGDRRVLRMLEAYVNFSIDFKMGVFARKEQAGPTGEVEGAPAGSMPSCPLVTDDLVAGTDDPQAAARAAKALGRTAPPASGTP